MHTPTDDNPADLLTKPLTGVKFIKFSRMVLNEDANDVPNEQTLVWTPQSSQCHHQLS